MSDGIRHRLLKKWFPGHFYRKQLRRGRHLVSATTAEVFTRIYREGGWTDEESSSGPGSNLAVTTMLRRKLPVLVKTLGARRFLDIPCGDFNWMGRVDLGVEEYIGADIVSEIVDRNNEEHAAEGRTFLKLDLIRDPLPRSDIVFCRDCLPHLQFDDIFGALENVRSSGSTFLLTTTYAGLGLNLNIVTGQWRPLDLRQPPFSFPEPMEFLDEQSASGSKRYRGKGIGVWRVADLPAFTGPAG